MRRWLPVAALAALAAAALLIAPTFGAAARIAFVLGSAPTIGSVLLRAIARLTGAGWGRALAPAPGLGWLALAAGAAMLAPTGAAPPAHLAGWLNPLFVAARAVVAVAALAWADARLRAGEGETTAGVTLALYAALVTPIAADWLLPLAPGHPVSAIGMMLFLVQFAAGCAVSLPTAETRARRDLALLLVAAVLGLSYLAYMDYLIVWYGDLPKRVPFYLDRAGWLAALAGVVGLVATAAVVVAGQTRAAALTAAVGLALFAMWWIGAGVLAAVLGVLVASVVAWGSLAVRHG